MTPYKAEPHNFKKPKRLPWLVCQHCGLVRLNNRLTEWAVQKGCNFNDHPDRQSAIIKFTGKHHDH